MSLFDNLPMSAPVRRPRPVSAPIDAAPLLACPPHRPSRAAVERTIMAGYAGASLAVSAVALSLEVPPASRYVALTVSAIVDARRIMEYRGSVPFSDVARLAGTVLA